MNIFVINLAILHSDFVFFNHSPLSKAARNLWELGCMSSFGYHVAYGAKPPVDLLFFLLLRFVHPEVEKLL